MREHTATQGHRIQRRIIHRLVGLGLSINSVPQKPFLTILFPLGCCLLSYSSPHPLISASLFLLPPFLSLPPFFLRELISLRYHTTCTSENGDMEAVQGSPIPLLLKEIIAGSVSPPPQTSVIRIRPLAWPFPRSHQYSSKKGLMSRNISKL